MTSRRSLAVALAIVAASGCGGGEEDDAADVTTSPVPRRQPCSPGTHALTLENRQSARMLVTPAASGLRALVVVLHGAGGSPASALEAFRGGWKTPGLVLIAPAAKGQTWSILRSEEDRDLESVNAALAAAYERCRIDRRRIAVGGFSDRATYALSLGLSNGDLFPAIMALSPGGVLAGEHVGTPRVFVSHGTLDGVLPIARTGDAVVRQLRAAGYRVEYRRFRGGHEASSATSAAAVRWFLVVRLPEGVILRSRPRVGTIKMMTLREDMTSVIEALFDIRRDVNRIVRLIEEESDGEQGDEEEDS